MKNFYAYFIKSWFIGLAILISSGCTGKPEFYSIGVTRNFIQSAYEEIGFTFKEGEMVFEQKQEVGLSRDSSAMVQLVGPENDLVTARVMVHVPPGTKKYVLNRKRSYLEKMIKLIKPNWKKGPEWLGDNAVKLGKGGSISTMVSGCKVTVRTISGQYILALIFGDWASTGIGFKRKKEWRTNEKKPGIGTGWALLLFVVFILVAGFITAIIDAERRRKKRLDLFQLPSVKEEKEYLKLIPLGKRESLPVEQITIDVLEEYKQSGFPVLAHKGKGKFFNLAVPLWPRQLMPETEFSYLKLLIPRHNYEHLKTIKKVAPDQIDMSHLPDNKTGLIQAGERIFEENETVLFILLPAQIFEVIGVLILTAKKIVFDALDKSKGGAGGFFIVCDYAGIKALDISQEGLSSGQVINLELTDGDKIQITPGSSISMAKNIDQVKKIIDERKGNKEYSSSLDLKEFHIGSLSAK